MPSENPGASPEPTVGAWDAERIGTMLAEVGIGVYEGPDADAPLVRLVTEPSPLRLLSVQLEGLRNELASGGGVLGADLDDLAALPDGAPPFSYLVAGWLARADTPEAERARSIIGEHDWHRPQRIIFPNLVLLLFVADIARHEAAESAAAPQPAPIEPLATESGDALGGTIVLARAAQPPIGLPEPVAATVCSGLQGWVNSVLDKFFTAIKINAQGESPVVQFLADIWNWAVELAKDIVTGLIETIGATALAAARIAIGVVGTLSLMASLTQPWTIEVIPPPVIDHFAHPGEADHEGTFTAKIKGNAEWADYVVDCAKVAGITLPDPAPAGKRVTWKAVSLAPISVASVLAAGTDQKVRDDGTAILTYRASREDANDPEGDLYHGSLQVQVRVERLSNEDLEKLFGTVVFSGTAGKILAQLLAPLTQQVTTKLAALATANGSEVHVIDYHRNDATPAPSTSPEPSTPALPTACLIGTWRLNNVAYAALLESLLGDPVVATVASGDQERTYEPGGRVGFVFDEFTVDVLMAQSTPTGGLVTEIQVVLDGDGHLSYEASDNDDGSLSVHYSGSASDIHVLVTEQVKFNGEVVPGAPLPFPITGPVQLIDATGSYSCAGNSLIEQTPLGPLNWIRVS